MNKFIYSCFAVLLLGLSTPTVNASTYYTNYNNIEMTENEYNNLVELGFTENEIYLMGNEEFEANKDIEGTLVSSIGQYYKTTTITQNGITTTSSEIISKEQYELEKNANPQGRSIYDGAVETDYKYMHMNMTQLNAVEMRLKITLTWLQIPSTRSNDIIGIGFQQAYVGLNSSIYFQQNYTNSSGSHSSVTSIPQEFSTGVSSVFDLPNGTITALSSYMYIDVIKVDEDYTITYMDAGGDYAHATSSISETNAKKHSVDHVSGIELQTSIRTYYDAINVATATFIGSW